MPFLGTCFLRVFIIVANGERYWCKFPMYMIDAGLRIRDV